MNKNIFLFFIDIDIKKQSCKIKYNWRDIMTLKASIYPWSGYFGYLRKPHESNYFTSIFMVCDQNRQELNLFLTQPGSYDTAYFVASRVHFRDINIFAISYDINFISDIYRLSHDLKQLGKNSVHTYFPEPFPMDIDTITSLNHIRKFTFNSNYDPNISVEYHINNREIDDKVKAGLMKMPTGLLYDIVIFLGNKTVILPAKMNDMILSECKCIDNAEIHLPYTQTLYGGYSYKDIMENNEIDRDDKKLCRVNCFSNNTELFYCKSDGRIDIADYLHKSLL